MGFHNLQKITSNGRRIDMSFFENKAVVLDGCNILVKTAWHAIGMAGQNSTHQQKIEYTIQQFLEVCRFVYIVFDGEPLPYKLKM